MTAPSPSAGTPDSVVPDSAPPALASPSAGSAVRVGPRRLGWSRRRKIVTVIVGVLLAAILGGTAYFAIPQPNLPEAAAALASTPQVAFSREDGRLVFRPAAANPTTGLVFYPGGKVDAAAYAPGAAAIAARGYLVVVVPMPLNLAVLNIEGATAAMGAHPEIRRWAIGGHSLGGAMAAQYLASHPGAAAGLVFWAAYSATGLAAQRDLRVLIAYGSLDAGVESYIGARALGNLPPDPIQVRIEGGNHEQMGWYTGQPNDPPATVSRSEQQARVVQATADLLASLGE